MPDLYKSVALWVRKQATTGLAVHLVGFALGTFSIATVFSGAINIESGLAVLTPFADLLYGLGIIMVVAVAARADIPTKYLVIAGAVIGIGLFYRSAPHEFHIASGIGFDLPHNGHAVMGTMIITVSVVAIAVLAFVNNKFRSEKAAR